MKILIIGGGGFIGSALLMNLPYEYEIISLDLGQKYPNLPALVKDNVKFMKGDIRDQHLLDKVMKEGIDVVIHLAGGGGNGACMKDPADAVTSYVHGTHLLLQKSREYQVKRFIFASSYVAYSIYKEREMPLTEDMELLPDDLYGALKAVAEYQIKDSGLSYIILRFSNVYGYRGGFNKIQKGGAIENFIKAAGDGSDITVFGEGSQKIDYVNLDDLVCCMEIILKDASVENQIFNLGSGKLFSIKQIAKIVSDNAQKLWGKKINIKSVPAPPGKIWPDRLMSIDKIKKQLGWKPSISLAEGIHVMMKNMEIS
ncbi:MAG: NAD-dependent epimerase/dehydratase family protein [Candidatus Saganbacteria bacterium]|nr:NAD-dependent epimerase/dehydratase family protein [Candidatus Saganbacteria bacterium]